MRLKRVIFDLDHTLWDFDKNSEETLSELFEKHSLAVELNTSEAQFKAAYRKINAQLWNRYNKRQVTKEALRIERFNLLFKRFNKVIPHLVEILDEEYIARCPMKPHIFPDALFVLEKLSNYYPIDIITNGFAETQKRKLDHSGIGKFISELTTSESCGYTKPHPKIFQYHLEKVKSSAAECIMIGDNPVTDIRGAASVGMKSVLFNPQKKGELLNAKYDFMISELIQLLTIMEVEP